MFGGGGGGIDPRKMQQMMEQMGIDMDDIDAEEVVIRTPEEELVFGDAEVQRMTAQGQETYQIVGEPETRERDAGAGEGDAGDGDVSESGADDGADEGASGDAAVPQEDVELVAMRADVSESEAREALEAADGDLASAVERLE